MEIFFKARVRFWFVLFMLLWNTLQILLGLSIILFKPIREVVASLGTVLTSIVVFAGFNIIVMVCPSYSYMQYFLHAIPHFNYVRIFYLLLIHGSSGGKPSELKELKICIFILFLHCVFWTLIIILKEQKSFTFFFRPNLRNKRYIKKPKKKKSTFQSKI